METRPGTLVRPREEFALVAQASLRPWFLAIQRHRLRLLRGYSAEDVHGLRGAGRRLRAGLRLYREELKNTPASPLSEALRDLLDALGKARDGDVFVELLRDPKLVGFVSAHPNWEHYAAVEERRLHRCRLAALAHLHDDHWTALAVLLDAFFAQAPGLPPAPETWADLLPRLSRRTGLLLRKLSAEAHPLRQRSPASRHEFRRNCRRARYWVELLEPTLGEPAARTVKTLSALSEVLGQIQDAESAARRLARRRSWWAKPVSRRLAKRATKATRRFAQRWRKARRLLAEGLPL